MAEVNVKPAGRARKVRHRGRMSQVLIYTGKMLRMFVYQNDWKVLPMAALIAALVSMVVRKDFFITMEGTLKGAFALTCVAIWNGCFNSIQVICRERGIIKREHRSGMHISSYIVSHMLYQALLCLAQTGLTMYVCMLMGVQFPWEGFFTPLMIVDIGITVFLITYASDMLSLWVSALAHNTTTAMTVMPFVLIFQLVFSGGIFSLPAWTQSFSNFTISNYGLKCIAAQANYNQLPMVTAWNTLLKLENKEIEVTFTAGEALDFLGNDENPVIHDLRRREVSYETTVGNAWSALKDSETWQSLRSRELLAQTSATELLSTLKTDVEALVLPQVKEEDAEDMRLLLDLVFQSLEQDGSVAAALGDSLTLGELADALRLDDIIAAVADQPIGGMGTLGDIIDAAASNPDLQSLRDKPFSLTSSVGRVIDLVGRDRLKTLITTKTAEVTRVAAYDMTLDNIVDYWFSFFVFILAFSALSVITLEFIDKDKR